MDPISFATMHWIVLGEIECPLTVPKVPNSTYVKCRTAFECSLSSPQTCITLLAGGESRLYSYLANLGICVSTN